MCVYIDQVIEGEPRRVIKHVVIYEDIMIFLYLKCSQYFPVRYNYFMGVFRHE